jgi:hypothetical protein
MGKRIKETNKKGKTSSGPELRLAHSTLLLAWPNFPTQAHPSRAQTYLGWRMGPPWQSHLPRAGQTSSTNPAWISRSRARKANRPIPWPYMSVRKSPLEYRAENPVAIERPEEQGRRRVENSLSPLILAPIANGLGVNPGGFLPSSGLFSWPSWGGGRTTIMASPIAHRRL